MDLGPSTPDPVWRVAPTSRRPWLPEWVTVAVGLAVLAGVLLLVPPTAPAPEVDRIGPLRPALRLALERVEDTPRSERATAAAELADVFGVPVTLVPWARAPVRLGNEAVQVADEVTGRPVILVPVIDDRRVLVIGPYADLPAREGPSLARIGLATLLVVLMTAAFVFPRARRLGTVVTSLRRIERGDLDARIEEGPPDGVGRVERAVNRLAAVQQRRRQQQRDVLEAIARDLGRPGDRMRGRLAGVGNREALERELDRIDDLVAELLAHLHTDRPPELNLRRVEVGEVIEASSRALAGLRGRIDASIRPPPGGERLAVRVDPRHFRRAIEGMWGVALRNASTSVVGTWAREGDRVAITILMDASRDGTGAVDPGMALAVVRRVVDWHGGSLELVSSEGGLQAPDEGDGMRTTWPLAD